MLNPRAILIKEDSNRWDIAYYLRWEEQPQPVTLILDSRMDGSENTHESNAMTNIRDKGDEQCKSIDEN